MQKSRESSIISSSVATSPSDATSPSIAWRWKIFRSVALEPWKDFTVTNTSSVESLLARHHLIMLLMDFAAPGVSCVYASLSAACVSGGGSDVDAVARALASTVSVLILSSTVLAHAMRRLHAAPCDEYELSSFLTPVLGAR